MNADHWWEAFESILSLIAHFIIDIFEIWNSINLISQKNSNEVVNEFLLTEALKGQKWYVSALHSLADVLSSLRAKAKQKAKALIYFLFSLACLFTYLRFTSFISPDIREIMQKKFNEKIVAVQ